MTPSARESAKQGSHEPVSGLTAQPSSSGKAQVQSRVGPAPPVVLKVRAFAAQVSLEHDPGESVTFTPANAWQLWKEGALRVHFVSRQPRPGEGHDKHLPPLLLGDDSEADDAKGEGNRVDGVRIGYDAAARRLVVHTSIVGLPALFLYRGPHGVALASDIHLLKRLPGVRLELDPAGVDDLGSFGYPVEQRTLFRDVSLVPGGVRLEITARGEVSIRKSWQLPERDPLDWASFIELQAQAFTEAMGRVDVGGTFLSLTGGLDTRTIFSVLASQARLIPAVTMTGTHRSLDARIASRLCRAYRVRHELITFDDGFSRELPRYVEMASRLSGGLASLGQAHELFFYERVGAGFTARLSGNLGNQVGRGGTEGLSMRGADLGILAARRTGEAEGVEHWMEKYLKGDERSRLQFILEREIPWSSVANYSVGNHFVVQQSPYANRRLIENLARRPTAAEQTADSRMRMRLRDLKHRFFGEPPQASFQRTLVARLGGQAATIPINWGWLPAGGFSPSGMALGVATFAGMAIRAKGLDRGVLGRPLAWSGLPALNDFRECRSWLRHDLRDFTLDTLGSRSLREAGLFDTAALGKVLDEHFTDRRDHHETVSFALDLGLAHRLFCQGKGD